MRVRRRLRLMKIHGALILRWFIPALGAMFAIAVLFWLYRDLDFVRFIAAVEFAKPQWLLFWPRRLF